MKIKMQFISLIFLSLTACAAGQQGNSSSLMGVDISEAIASGVDSIKKFDATMSGSVKNDFPIEKTGLYNVFKDKPFEDTEASSYLRVALTVLKSPVYHADILPLGGSNPIYETGCFTLSATIWHSKSKKEVIERFDFCTPGDGVYGVPFSNVSLWAIRPIILGILEESSTGLRRTTGPGAPTKSIPTDPRSQKYFKSSNISVNQYDGFMLASILYKMGFDWSELSDRRVWIVEFSDANR